MRFSRLYFPAFLSLMLIQITLLPAAESPDPKSMPVEKLLKADGYQGNQLASGDEDWDGRFTFPGQGLNGAVLALAASGSDIYAGGEFTQAGSVQASHIAKWNGSSWSALGSGLSGAVSAIAVGNGIVYAVGAFSQAGGVPVNNIAKWDGSQWYALGSGINGEALALAVDGNTVYAGGLFASAGGISANNIAKWDGSQWITLKGGVNGKVRALALNSAYLYVGGEFTSADGIEANYIARWDRFNWLPLERGLDGFVRALSVQSGDIIVGGDFTNALYGTDNAVWADYIVRWDGSAWSSMKYSIYSGVSAPVFSIAATGTHVFIGGLFTEAKFPSASHIVKWDQNSWMQLGSGANDCVVSMAVSGSDVYAGGMFCSTGGKASSNFGCWHEHVLAPQFVWEPLEILAGSRLTFRPKVKGWPAPVVSLVSGPEGMVYESQWNTIRWNTWNMKPDQAGRHPFTLKAENDAGTACRDFMVWVDLYNTMAAKQNTGRVEFTALNDGSVGKRGSYVPGEVGFILDGKRGLYEGQLVIGKSPSRVSGGLYLREFGILSPVVSIASNLDGFDQACQARFTDAKMLDPIGVEILQRSHSKSSDPDRDYIIMEYWIKNTTVQELTGIHVGLAMDWDVGQFRENLGGYDAAHGLCYTYETGASTDPDYFGVAVLTGEVSGSAIWKNGSDDNSDGVLYERMTHFSNEDESVPADRRSMMSTGPYTIPPGDSVRCVFAVLGGNNLADLKANADTAASRMVSNEQWSVPLSVVFNNNPPLVRSFGGHPDATDAYDRELDILSPPASPGFSVFFGIDRFPYNLIKDVRRWAYPYDEAVDWNLEMDALVNSVVLSWNPSDFPSQGNFTLVRGSQRINMRESTQCSFPGDNSRTLIQYRPSTQASVSYEIDRDGWWLISLPVVPQDSTVGTLFPGLNNHYAYSWDPATRSYITHEKMEPGRAYWIYFWGTSTCTVTGAPLRRFTSSPTARGWTMIGSPAGGADFTRPVSDPDGLVWSPAFGWDPGMRSYFSTGRLDEKRGYWVAVMGACDMTVAGSDVHLGKGTQSLDRDAFFRECGSTPPGPPEVSGVEQDRYAVPSEFDLLQNFPNPFNAQTKITYILAEASQVDLCIYDARGSLVYEYSPARREAGTHTVVWDAADRPSGMYMVELKSGSFRQMRKCLLLK